MGGRSTIPDQGSSLRRHRPRGRKPPECERRGSYAAIDLGTNNCRLLVARPIKAGFTVIDAFSRIVRLGEGLTRTGVLSTEAVERTVRALGVCAQKVRRCGDAKLRAVATEACRQADNFSEFRELVRDRTGLEIEVISSSEEARLALRGCLPLLDEGIDHALVFDIGGGSTEVMWLTTEPDERGGADRLKMQDCISLPLGVVGLSERFGPDSMCAGGYEQIIGEVTRGLAAFDERNGIGKAIASGRGQILGCSGTVTTLAGVHQGLPRYDRSVIDGCHLPAAVARQVCQALLGMSYDQRAAQPCIGRDRADLVLSGSAILEGILQIWPGETVRVADRGVREGILLEMMQSDRDMQAELGTI